MKVLVARKAVGALVTAVLAVSSPGAHSWAAAVAAAKAVGGGRGAPVRVPAVLPAAQSAWSRPGTFPSGGPSLAAALPRPAALPAPGVAGAGSGANATPEGARHGGPAGLDASVALPLPIGAGLADAAPALPLAASAERLGEMAAVIGPDLEGLRAREVGGEQARGLAERVMAPVLGGTPVSPLLSTPGAPAPEPLTEKNIMAVLRLLSQKQRGGYELLGQTGLTPEGLRRVIERIDAMGMLFIHGSLQARDIGTAQVSLKPSASGAAMLISRPWPGTDTLGSRALDALALLQTKVRFGYELMSALELDRSKLENLIAELQNTGLIHLSGDFRGPGADNALVSILPSNIGKVKAVLERKRLLKLLLPVPAAFLSEAATTGLAAPGSEPVPLPDPTLKRLSPKIAVTPVSEHLPGVIFVKFLRATTLEVMLGVLARNGVKPELHADNGDGFRVRVALPDREAAEAAGRLAAEGQVEIIEVSRRVFDMLRQGGAAGVEIPGVRASDGWPNKTDHALAGAGALAAAGAFALAGVTYALGLAAGAVVVMAAGAALWLDADYRAHRKKRDGHASGGRERAFRIVGSFLAGAGFTGLAVGLGAQILLAPFRESVTVLMASLGGFGGFQLGLKRESRDNGLFHRAGDEFRPVALSTLAGIALGVGAGRFLFYLLGVHAPATLLDGLREIFSGARGSLLGLLAIGIGGVFQSRPKEPSEAARQLDGLLVERLGALAVKEVEVQPRGGRASLVVFLTRPVDESLIPKEHQGAPWMGRTIASEVGGFPRGTRSAAGASPPANGRGAKNLHDAYKDRGELLGGSAGILLALGVGAWAFSAALANLALPVAIFWGAAAALAVGMLTTLGLASLGRDIGGRLGQEKVDRIHLNFLARHRGRIEAVPGVASVRYQISIPGLSDAVTPADGPLFVVVLDGTVAYETVHRDLKAAAPGLAGFPVFFEKGDKR